MPLKFNNVQTNIGIPLSECYVRISSYQGDMENLTLWLSIYASQAAYENKGRPVADETLTIAVSELAKSTIFSYLYDNIIYAPAFQKYTPSVLELPYVVAPAVVDPSVTPDPNVVTVTDPPPSDGSTGS